MLDKCILYRARATVVNLAECAPGVPWGPTPTPVVVQELLRKRKWEDDQQQKHITAESYAVIGDQAGSARSAEADTVVSTDLHADTDTQDSAAREKVEPVDTEGQYAEKRPKQQHHPAGPEHSSSEARAAAHENDDVDDGQDEDFTLSRLVFVHSRGKWSQQRSPHTSTSPVLVLFVALTCVTLPCAGPTEPRQQPETPPRWCCQLTRRCPPCALSLWATAFCAAWCASSR
jgi:hypothetical protein